MSASSVDLEFSSAAAPDRDCPLCPRLVEFRHGNRQAHPDWWNGPAAPFGSPRSRLLIVGLAPGLQGANRTGRPFTGDYAGALLYATLKKYGFAAGDYQARPDDGFCLKDCAILNAVRCVPPQNKPTPAEIKTCGAFLKAGLSEMDALQVVVALGRVAHESVLRMLGARLAAYPFAHGAEHRPASRAFVLIDSYHCSRYNTNTGVLTTAMFEAVIARARAMLPS